MGYENCGRKTILTDELIEEIAKWVRKGNFIETAACYCNITSRVVRKWIKRGREEIARLDEDPRARPKKSEEIFVRFFEAMEQAQAYSEMLDLQNIEKASGKNWTASAWRLERKFPEKYGIRRQTTGGGANPVTLSSADGEHGEAGVMDVDKMQEEIDETALVKGIVEHLNIRRRADASPSA